MSYSGFWRRLAAWIMDLVVVYVAATVVGLFGFSLGGGIGLGASLYMFFVLEFLYYWLLTAYLGQTLGKMVLSIKVVNASGKPPGLGRAFLREFIGKPLSGLFASLGYLWVAWDPKKQGWHDKIAGTFVVRDAAVAADSTGPSATGPGV